MEAIVALQLSAAAAAPSAPPSSASAVEAVPPSHAATVTVASPGVGSGGGHAGARYRRDSTRGGKPYEAHDFGFISWLKGRVGKVQVRALRSRCAGLLEGCS